MGVLKQRWQLHMLERLDAAFFLASISEQEQSCNKHGEKTRALSCNMY